jgi:hypothetical protein
MRGIPTLLAKFNLWMMASHLAYINLEVPFNP